MKKLVGYGREKYLAELLGVRAVPFSGSKFQAGREDLEDEHRLFQVKSTRSNLLTVRFRDLFDLLGHAQQKMPHFVLDFMQPTIATPAGDELTLPEDIWMALPLADYDRLYAAYIYVQKFLSEGES